jgi:TldD protein
MPLKSSPARPRFVSSIGNSAVATAAVFLSAAIVVTPPASRAQQPKAPPLLDAMTSELHRAFTSLGKPAAGTQASDKQLPPYFLSYAVSDASYAGIRAQFGALVDSATSRVRVADIQVRLGEPSLDNTHGTHRGTAVNSAPRKKTPRPTSATKIRRPTSANPRRPW